MEQSKAGIPWVGAVLYNDQGQILLVRKKKHERKGKIIWKLPGGQLSPTSLTPSASRLELETATVIKEVNEETGIQLAAADLEILTDRMMPWLIDGQEVLRRAVLFLAQVKDDRLAVHDQTEIAEARWWNWPEVKNQKLPGTVDNLVELVAQEYADRIKPMIDL